MASLWRHGWWHPARPTYRTKSRFSCLDRRSATTTLVLKSRRQIQGSTYNGELDICWCYFGSKGVDVFNPLVVLVQAVGRDSNDLDVPLSKISSTAGHLAEFSGANRGKISRMREKNGLYDDQVDRQQ